MHSKKHIFTTIGTCFLFLSIIGFGKTYLVQKDINSATLLKMPVELANGTSYEEELTVSKEGRYFISLNFNKDIENDKLACKIGMDSTVYNCSGIEALVDISWEIQKNNEVILNGLSSDYPWNDAGSELEKTIAQVNLSKGTYQFKITQLKDASELNTSDPVLKVEQSPLDIKNELIYGSLIFLFSGSLLLIGLLTLGLASLLRLFKRH